LKHKYRKRRKYSRRVGEIVVAEMDDILFSRLRRGDEKCSFVRRFPGFDSVSF
jgi:hypothetical protein